MKAVLGMLFILVGLTTGWLVISGKLPNATASSTDASAAAALPTDAQINNRYRNQNGPTSSTNSFTASPIGLPTRIS